MAKLVSMTLVDSSGRRVKGKIELLKLPVQVVERPHHAYEMRVESMDLTSHDGEVVGATYAYTKDADGANGTFILSPLGLITLTVSE